MEALGACVYSHVEALVTYTGTRLIRVGVRVRVRVTVRVVRGLSSQHPEPNPNAGQEVFAPGTPRVVSSSGRVIKRKLPAGTLSALPSYDDPQDPQVEHCSDAVAVSIGLMSHIVTLTQGVKTSPPKRNILQQQQAHSPPFGAVCPQPFTVTSQSETRYGQVPRALLGNASLTGASHSWQSSPYTW